MQHGNSFKTRKIVAQARSKVLSQALQSMASGRARLASLAVGGQLLCVGMLFAPEAFWRHVGDICTISLSLFCGPFLAFSVPHS